MCVSMTERWSGTPFKDTDNSCIERQSTRIRWNPRFLKKMTRKKKKKKKVLQWGKRSLRVLSHTQCLVWFDETFVFSSLMRIVCAQHLHQYNWSERDGLCPNSTSKLVWLHWMNQSSCLKWIKHGMCFGLWATCFCDVSY